MSHRYTNRDIPDWWIFRYLFRLLETLAVTYASILTAKGYFPDQRSALYFVESLCQKVLDRDISPFKAVWLTIRLRKYA